MTRAGSVQVSRARAAPEEVDLSCFRRTLGQVRLKCTLTPYPCTEQRHRGQGPKVPAHYGPFIGTSDVGQVPEAI